MYIFFKEFLCIKMYLKNMTKEIEKRKEKEKKTKEQKLLFYRGVMD